MINKKNTKIKVRKKTRQFALYFDDMSDDLYYGLKIAAHEYKTTMPKLIKIILTLYIDEGKVNAENVKEYFITEKANEAKKKSVHSEKYYSEDIRYIYR